jgi:hypothetical protein
MPSSMCHATVCEISRLAHASVVLLGVSIAHMGGDKALGRVDELFDANPRGHQMNECEKGLAQFLIPRGNASKLFEFVKEPFHLLP